MKTFLDYLTEQQSTMSGWTNIHTGKTVSGDTPHAMLVARNPEVFDITEKEIRNAIEERNAYRVSINLPPHSLDNIEEAFLKIFDGHYGRFYNDGWMRWHYGSDHNFMDFTSAMDTLSQAYDHIVKLAQQFDPESVMISNMHGDSADPKMMTLNGEDVKQGNFSI